MKGVVTATIMSEGSSMNSAYNVMSIDIVREVNKIPLAQIILLDGNAAKQEFAISNTDFFLPGKKIEIKLRYERKPQDEATVFKGIVVRHSLQADRYTSMLIVDIKDVAIKLTTQRKSAVFRERTDQDIIESIITNAGLQAGSIAATKANHKEMVQYYSTDWDFIVSRADVNGHWVLVDNGEISVEKPNFSGASKYTFNYGISNIYELEMSADISQQYAAVESLAWDIKEQAITAPYQAENVSLNQGDLSVEELATAIGASNYQLISPSQLDDQEIQAWGDAKLLKSRLSLLRGRLQVPGFADIKLGESIEIQGTSNRFNGQTIVTAIRHQVNEQGWQTDLQFGLSADFFTQKNQNIIDTPAAGLVPAINGLQIGIVDQYEEDPENIFRVKVKIPTIEADGIVWARLATVEAGNERGVFFRPEAGDEVILGFINDDPRQAIILGAVHSQINTLPEGLEVTEENSKKGIVTKNKLKIIFDDENKVIEISTPNKNGIKISEEKKGIVLEDENGNTITMDDQGIQIKSSADIALEGTNVTIKGSKVDIN